MEKQERKQEPKREPQGKDEVKANPKVIEAGKPALAGPASGTGDEAAAGNPTEFLLVIGLLIIDQKGRGVVEIFSVPTCDVGDGAQHEGRRDRQLHEHRRQAEEAADAARHRRQALV